MAGDVERPARRRPRRCQAGWWRAALAVLCLALVTPLPASAQRGTSDPGFWVILPDGGMVPYNHPLAIDAGSGARPAPQERAAPSPPSAPPQVDRGLTPADPGFWVKLPDGGMVPYNHPLAVAAGQGPRPAPPQRPAPSPPASPVDRGLTPADPDFWVMLPDGGMVPYNHPLAIAATTRSSGSTTAPASSSSTSSAPSSPSPSRPPATAPQPAPPPAPAPQPDQTSGAALKVLTWNIQHGVGTDGSYNLDRLAAWIAKAGANVVSLNEVEKFTSWGNEDQPARFASLLRSHTGRTWHYHFAERNGGTKGQGNLLLSTFPIESAGEHQLSYSRSVARIAIVVNGVRVNVLSTHLDAESSARRATQMRELTRWAETYPEQRLIAGDFNAWPGAGEISNMTSAHDDTWAVAASQGTAVAFAGNEKGNTRNSRIDYVFRSKGAARLRLDGVRVLDTRDSRGHMPSDHRPLVASFTVR